MKARLSSKIFRRALTSSLVFAASSALSQQILSNPSFEAPVGTAVGNNFYNSIPSWTIIPAGKQFNIVKPNASYTGGPSAPPAGGGLQYLDIVGSDGSVTQLFTLGSAAVVDFSAWFSVRDMAQALTGMAVNIRNSANTVVASASTSFLATDAFGIWKQASATNISLAAGTYTFEVAFPDPANADLASLVVKPPLSISKTGVTYSDPVNGTANPKSIPGGITEYTLTVTNPSNYTVSNNSILIIDKTPPNVDLLLSDIGSAGSGPARFAPSSSTLTYSFASLSSSSDNVDFSNNNGSTWTYSPAPNANGVDAAVTNIRLRPQGSMAASSSFTFGIRYRVR